jgi:hypothetical protein
VLASLLLFAEMVRFEKGSTFMHRIFEFVGVPALSSLKMLLNTSRLSLAVSVVLFDPVLATMWYIGVTAVVLNPQKENTNLSTVETEEYGVIAQLKEQKMLYEIQLRHAATVTYGLRPIPWLIESFLTFPYYPKSVRS